MTRVIRPLVEADAEALLALRIANREFMRPFDPERPPAFFTLERQREIAIGGSATAFAIMDGRDLAGMITLSNMSFGPFQSANVGYWVDAKRNGRGLASRALAAILQHAFDELGLHRVEAGTLIDNLPSQRVLEKNGFEKIGLARSYLNINGAWRDHILFHRTDDRHEGLTLASPDCRAQRRIHCVCAFVSR
jgi:ribosomal-protein-alanine N-acetyltransferase